MKTYLFLMDKIFHYFFITILQFVVILTTNILTAQEKCISGNCINGFGIYRYVSGSIFEGSFIEGKPLKGVYRFPNGDYYKGDFQNNRFHGNGYYYYKKSGNTFVGNYTNGEKTYGTFTYSDGSTYTGNFKNQKKDGRGKLVTAKGKVFDGYWDADMYIGAKTGNSVQTYAVIIGVSDYMNFDPLIDDLKFARLDARSFKEYLESVKGGKVPASNINLLLDSDASYTNILQACRQLFGKADINDRIIFFFSGHGSNHGFFPYDVEYMGINFLTYNLVKQLFAKSKASVKLIFADACHSGSIGNHSNSQSDRKPNAEEDIKLNLPQSNHRNVAIMMSSDGNQKSFESASLRHGVFTYFLIRGLSGHADKNNDNLITMEEIYYYVRDKTYNYVEVNMRKTQTPILFGKFDREMIIGVY